MNYYDKSPSSLFSNPWVFFGATFVWTWVFWGLGILLRISMESAFGIGLLILGVLGPMVTGIGFTYLTKNKAGQRDYWLCIIDVRRIGLKWFLILLLFVPALNGLAALIDVVLGGTGAVWGNTLTGGHQTPLPVDQGRRPGHEKYLLCCSMAGCIQQTGRSGNLPV